MRLISLVCICIFNIFIIIIYIDLLFCLGSRSIIGADTMVPLFTMVLIHARIPNIHLLLYILMQYGEYDEQGDISYNIANLEGSMQFIMQMEIPQEIMDRFQQTSLYESIITSINGNIFHRKMSLVGGKEGASMVMDPTGNHLLTAYSPSSFNESALKASFASANSISTASQEELRALDLKAMQELGKSIFFCFVSNLLVCFYNTFCFVVAVVVLRRMVKRSTDDGRDHCYFTE